MGWILPKGGVPELAHTIARNLYGRAPKELTPSEQDVVVAWIAGRAPVTEAEVRRDLLADWVADVEARGVAGAQSLGGPQAPSSTVQARSVASGPLGVRLAQSTLSSTVQRPKHLDAEARPLTLWEGASHIGDAATFATLAKAGSMPGAAPMREVKFLLTGAARGAPHLSFMNTNAYDAHAAFAKALGGTDDLAAFNARAYFDPARDIVCGSIVAVEGTGGAVTYALQFLPTDPMTTDRVARTHALVSERAPFLKDALVYHPVGDAQVDVAERGQGALVAAGVKVTSTAELLGDVSFQPLNEGVGFGVLRVIDGSDPRPPTAKDVCIFTRLPNDVAHTAGVITLDPQTPLSHVNLKAKQNGTPNAFINDATSLKEVKALVGSVVRFEVTAGGYSLRAATAAEAQAHMEALRPAAPVVPARDLSVTTPRRLSDIGHDDVAAFGAKSTNAAELLRCLPAHQRVDGVAVPFALYEQFMEASGLKDAARAMLSEPRFRTDETYRENRLKRFRRDMRETPLPPMLQQQLKDLEASFPAGSALRLRSSTNNEDLPGFNGAGLYSSRTYDPSQPATAQRATLGDAIKDVWSSLWTFRAVEERSFHKVDHFATAMGVLVHPSYGGDGAAGVAVTKNIYDPKAPGLYVNVQPKDDLVTSPEGGVVPEELLLRPDVRTGAYVAQTLRRSSLSSGAVLTPAQHAELATALDTIQRHFRRVHGAQGDAGFAMDVEFIIDAGRVRVVQARPWVD